MHREYPTPKQCLQFYSYMQKTYDLKVVNKATSPTMKIVGGTLSTFGVMPYKTFMEGYTTCFWGTLYANYTVGDHSTKYLDRQISILVHECQHAVQELREGRFKYSCRYIFSSHQRALIEIEAYIATMEIYHWFTGEHLDSQHMAEKLYAYNCNEGDVLMAKVRFDEAKERMDKGEVITGAVFTALQWLDPRFPVMN